jgi:hypothetical protein
MEVDVSSDENMYFKLKYVESSLPEKKKNHRKGKPRQTSC